jgi:hypothetical protein
MSMEKPETARPTGWWNRAVAAPRRLSFWVNGISAILATFLLFGDQLAGLAQGKAMLWYFEAFDRFRGELIVVCVLLFLGGWITASLSGAGKGLVELFRRGRPSKAQAGALVLIALVAGVLAVIAVKAGLSYNENRMIAWRRYEPTLVLRAQQALANHQDKKGEFLLRAAAEVEGNHSAREMLSTLADRKQWSADFWAFYDQVPEGSRARWELLFEEAPFELNRARLENEADRIRSRYQQERPRFIEAISWLQKGETSRATENLRQVCNSLQWIGNCRVLLRDLESGQETGLLAALKRYGPDRFSREVLEEDDSRMRVNLFEASEDRWTYEQLLEEGLIPSEEPSDPVCGDSQDYNDTGDEIP